MILPFSTQMNGKPTYFVEKILASLIAYAKSTNNQLFIADIMRFAYRYSDFFKMDYQELLTKIKEVNPKHHTIREDKNNRWHNVRMIDFFINCRQKDMFRFAPRTHVDRTQKIEIIYYTDGESPIKKAVIIDDKKRLNGKEIKNLAMNDGFDTVNEFFAYFNVCFKGKIIHWTDLRY